MKIIDYDQAAEWLSERGFHLENEPGDKFPEAASFAIPSDAGQKTAMARILASEICSKNCRGILLITGWGIWPSGENWALFSMVRKAMGEVRPISEAPGHVFESADRSELECMLDIILYFLWDAILVTESGEILCQFSHDEHVALRGRDGSALEDALRNFAAT